MSESNTINFILIDMDDTLIDTKHVYDEARRKAYDFVINKGYRPSSDNYDTYRDITIHQNHIYRQKKIKAEKRTPQSIIDGIETTFGKMPNSVKNKIRQMGRDIFTTPPPVKEDAIQALRELKQHIKNKGLQTRIVVFTQGDAPWQMQKFNSLEQADKDIFDHVLVVKDKKGGDNGNAYSDFLNWTQLNGNQCIMIGDKQGADSDPAYKEGMNVYLIPVYDLSTDLREKFKKKALPNYHVSCSMAKAVPHMIATYLDDDSNGRRPILKKTLKVAGHRPKR